MNQDELYRELLTTRTHNQVVVAIEELSEFAKELCKYLRGKPDAGHILEEYVDVIIMMEQMKILFNLQDEDIERFKNYKLARLEQRMKNNTL